MHLNPIDIAKDEWDECEVSVTEKRPDVGQELLIVTKGSLDEITETRKEITETRNETRKEITELMIQLKTLTEMVVSMRKEIKELKNLKTLDTRGGMIAQSGGGVLGERERNLYVRSHIPFRFVPDHTMRNQFG